MQQHPSVLLVADQQAKDMMEQHYLYSNEQLEAVRALAADLLRQAERCALLGMTQQAEAVLIEVWTMIGDHDAELANLAAWNISAVLLQRGAYGEAVEWVRRLQLPVRLFQIWPMFQRTLVELCQQVLQHTSVEETVRPVPSAASPLVMPTALPRLSITSLGHFQITRATTLLAPCKARKAIGIFRYLLTRQQHAASKEEIMEMFWPNATVRQAAHSLHVAIAALRRYLDSDTGSYVRFEADHYLIDPEAVIADDRQQFIALADRADAAWQAGQSAEAQQQYAAARSYYHGDYVVDHLDLPWAIAERERLLTRYLRALDHLGRILFAQGDFDAAADCYRALLERDTYREDAHYQLMLCYWHMGRRGEALRQYGLCRTTLANELGLEPMPDLQELYQTIIGDSCANRP